MASPPPESSRGKKLMSAVPPEVQEAETEVEPDTNARDAREELEDVKWGYVLAEAINKLPPIASPVEKVVVPSHNSRTSSPRHIKIEYSERLYAFLKEQGAQLERSPEQHAKELLVALMRGIEEATKKG